MARYEDEGYCPYQWVGISVDNPLYGFWRLIGPNVVYEKEDDQKHALDTVTCNEIFSTDPIAYDVLSGIVKKNVNAEKILVHQLHRKSDIQIKLAELTNPQLIVHAGSNFVVILADASYGIDVWVWYLKYCW